MTIKDWLLPELDHEMAMTRRVLERVPASALDWKPHEKSYTLGALATHLALLPRWGRTILSNDSYDLASSEGRKPDAAASPAAVLEIFDRHAAEFRQALNDRVEGELAATWSLMRGDRLLMSMPRVVALRRFLINHAIHHRGQLTVYLRLQNQPLPPLYGPTADETM